MADITSLIERIEAATEGSRELDVAVILALHPEAGPYQPYFQGDEPIFWNDPYRKMRCPEVSTSIDAALTLLPEGYAVTNMMIWPGERASLTLIETHYRPFGKDRRMSWVQEAGCRRWQGNGATAVLALLAAILRARQTEPHS